MQIWIYFIPGAGGDGFANLLEHSKSVTPIDHNLHWRIHRRVDNLVKFYAPSIDTLACFRKSVRFDSSTNQLNSAYLDLVQQNTDTVCTSHDVTLQALKFSDCLDVLTKNQIKVFLRGTDDDSRLCYLKNLSPYMPNFEKPQVELDQFDYVLDIELVQKDWSYVNHWCNSVGLELENSFYVQYQNILAGSREYDYPGVENYVSSVVDQKTLYTLIENDTK